MQLWHHSFARCIFRLHSSKDLHLYQHVFHHRLRWQLEVHVSTYVHVHKKHLHNHEMLVLKKEIIVSGSNSLISVMTVVWHKFAQKLTGTWTNLQKSMVLVEPLEPMSKDPPDRQMNYNGQLRKNKDYFWFVKLPKKKFGS